MQLEGDPILVTHGVNNDMTALAGVRPPPYYGVVLALSPYKVRGRAPYGRAPSFESDSQLWYYFLWLKDRSPVRAVQDQIKAEPRGELKNVIRLDTYSKLFYLDANGRLDREGLGDAPGPAELLTLEEFLQRIGIK